MPNINFMIKAGILGSHEYTDEYLKQLKHMNTFSVVGIHDTNDERTINISRQHGVKLFLHPDDLLNEVDAIFTAPGFNSYQCLKNALRKSKHLFVEPPLPYNSNETKELINLSEEAEVIVQIGFKHRYNPAFLAAQPFISPQVRMIHTHHLKEYKQDDILTHPVNDLMIHDIDNILSVVNSEIRKISAYGMSTSNTIPDVVNAIIEFHNGCIANLTASKISSRNVKKAVFYNLNDYVSIDMLNFSVYRFSKASDVNLPIFSENFSNLIKESIPVKNANELEDEFNAFSNSILKLHASEISLENTNRTMRVVEEINSKIKLTSNCS
jgi:predicted dehydrogenase